MPGFTFVPKTVPTIKINYPVYTPSNEPYVKPPYYKRD